MGVWRRLQVTIISMYTSRCASCGETETGLWPDEDTEPQYFKQFHCYERPHYCAACWDGWSEWPQQADDESNRALALGGGVPGV